MHLSSQIQWQYSTGQASKVVAKLLIIFGMRTSHVSFLDVMKQVSSRSTGYKTQLALYQVSMVQAIYYVYQKEYYKTYHGELINFVVTICKLYSSF